MTSADFGGIGSQSIPFSDMESRGMWGALVLMHADKSNGSTYADVIFERSPAKQMSISL